MARKYTRWHIWAKRLISEPLLPHGGTCPVRLVYATVLPRFAIFLPCASVRIEYDGKYKINKCKPQRLCFCGFFLCFLNFIRNCATTGTVSSTPASTRCRYQLPAQMLFTGFAPSAGANEKHPSTTGYRGKQNALLWSATIYSLISLNKSYHKRTHHSKNVCVRFLCVSAHLTLIFLWGPARDIIDSDGRNKQPYSNK